MSYFRHAIKLPRTNINWITTSSIPSTSVPLHSHRFTADKKKKTVRFAEQNTKRLIRTRFARESAKLVLLESMAKGWKSDEKLNNLFIILYEFLFFEKFCFYICVIYEIKFNLVQVLMVFIYLFQSKAWWWEINVIANRNARSLLITICRNFCGRRHFIEWIILKEIPIFMKLLFFSFLNSIENLTCNLQQNQRRQDFI